MRIHNNSHIHIGRHYEPSMELRETHLQCRVHETSVAKVTKTTKAWGGGTAISFIVRAVVVGGRTIAT